MCNNIKKRRFEKNITIFILSVLIFSFQGCSKKKNIEEQNVSNNENNYESNYESNSEDLDVTLTSNSNEIDDKYIIERYVIKADDDDIESLLEETEVTVEGATDFTIEKKDSNKDKDKDKGKDKGKTKDASDTSDAPYFSDKEIEQVINSQGKKYYFNTMDKAYQRVYAELYLIIMNHDTDVKISTNDSDELFFVYQCLINDHPEIFWVDGYEYVRLYEGNKIVGISFSGRYSYSKAECDDFNNKIAQYVNQFKLGISDDFSEYDKVKYTYEYVIKNTYYDSSARDNQNILSVFVYGNSVCQGYSKATQYLLEQLNVSATIVSGRVSDNGGHAWNLVNIDNNYYYLDTTWGDTSYANNVNSQFAGEISYDYLNVTTEELTKTHTITSIVSMPYCIANEANYYIHEGLFLSEYDITKLTSMFERAYSNGCKSITFKCADENVFAEVYNKLVEEQQVFFLLKGTATNISYAKSQDRLIFTFWI